VKWFEVLMMLQIIIIMHSSTFFAKVSTQINSNNDNHFVGYNYLVSFSLLNPVTATRDFNVNLNPNSHAVVFCAPTCRTIMRYLPRREIVRNFQPFTLPHYPPYPISTALGTPLVVRSQDYTGFLWTHYTGKCRKSIFSPSQACSRSLT
jgi:hypothetical protein